MRDAARRLRGAACALVVLTAASAAAAQDEARPRSLLHVAAGGEPQTVLLVEKDTQTMFVYECAGHDARLVTSLPCTTGKAAGDKQFEGDLKTPEGVYWFRRYIPDEALPPLYGAGALTMDYPNDFDRLDGKTGSGIWMHGVETNDRVEIARDTRGCVALRNDDFAELLPRLSLGRTPIVVVQRVEHDGHEVLVREADELRALLEQWRRAWETKDLPSYLALYDEGFRAPGHVGRESWARHKQQLASRYAGIRIGIDDVTMLREKDRLWLTFRQEYASDGHRDVGLKTLCLLDRDGTGPRIVSERWRPLQEDFLLIDPDSIQPMSPTLLASLYPDAAASGAPAPTLSAAVEAPPVRVAVRAPEPRLEPVLEERAGPALSSASETKAPALAATGRPPETGLPPVQAAPATPAASVAPAAEPIATIAPEPSEPAAAPLGPAPDLRPRILHAELVGDGGGRRVVRLLAPFARLTPVGLRVQVQLLNVNPARRRSGVLSWTAELPGLAPVGAEPPRRSVDLRQGELLELDLPLPLEPGPVLVMVELDDAAGRAALRQTIRIEVPPAPEEP